MFPKYSSFLCKVAAIIGLIPWLDVTTGKISVKIYKNTRILLCAAYALLVIFDIWQGFHEKYPNGSTILLHGVMNVATVIFLSQILYNIAFTDMKHWQVFFQMLYNIDKLHSPIRLNWKPVLIFVLIGLLLLTHYLCYFQLIFAFKLIRVMHYEICHIIVFSSTYFGYIVNNILSKAYEKNNISLKRLVNDLHSDFLYVHRYIRTCKIRKSGQVYRDVTRLVDSYSSLMLCIIWFPLAMAMVQLQVFYNHDVTDFAVIMIYVTIIIVMYVVSCNLKYRVIF